jgi:uncharacterized protein (DUF488 family)
MNAIKLFTIGFTKKSAEKFFNLLCNSGVRRIVDVRLNNTSQLAGFAKRDDLRYFLKEICNIDYLHLPDLAPTQEIMDEFKKNKGDWSVYQQKFLALLAERHIAQKMQQIIQDSDCLMCSEATPRHCHRRLVAEYFKDSWGGVEICHLE